MLTSSLQHVTILPQEPDSISTKTERVHREADPSLSATIPNASDTFTLLRVLAKEELFDVFSRVHCEGGKHLGRDRMIIELKKRYCGFSKAVVQHYVNLCKECQLNKGKKVTNVKPIHSPDFVSRGQVDLIEFQNTGQVNRPFNFILVYQYHHIKFVVLCSLIHKSAEEVSRTLFEIFCLIGSPHILQSRFYLGY